jgi:cell division protein FtsQ
MKAYNAVVQDLDSSGARYSQDLSEVDLSDLENIKVRVNDPAGDVLVQLGASEFLKRYQIYVGHVREWRQQFQKLESVNLRYDNQVIVNPDVEGRPKAAPLTPASAKAAAAAGVKQAALVSHSSAHEKALPKPVFELSQTRFDMTSGADKKPLPTTRVKKAIAKAPGKQPVKHWTPKKAAGKGPAAKLKTAHAAWHKPEAKKPGHSAAASATPKPSAAIAKQQSNTSD